MTEIEFIRHERQKMMREKPWTEEDFERKSKVVMARVPHGSANDEREKLRLWMQIQNEARRVLELADRKGIVVIFKQEAPK